jgi:putative DNA primase/helicase
MNAYDRLVAVLESHGSNVRSNGTRATARCPAHEDHNPSLSLRRIEGQALIHCFAGCQTVDVLAALNLGLRDLYDDQHGAAYRYDDGRVVHRSPGKRFRQSGQTNGTPQLYRLTRVIEAVRAGGTIYLVEGEKDVHAIESLGAVATTSPMGASNWHKVDPSPLYGGHVIVVPDRDQLGEGYARDAVATLTGKAASVKVMHAKVGKDASDHIAAGHGLDDLVEVDLPDVIGASAATVVTLASVKPERVTWLWDGHLPAGKLVVLDGDPSVGKSTLAIDWGARLSTGTSWPDGSHCPVGDVLVLSAEDGLADTIRPRLDAAAGNAARVHALTDVTFRDDEGNLHRRSVTLADVEQIRAAVEKYGARLVIIDVLMAYLPGKVDSHKDQDIRTVLARLADLGEKTGCCILLLRHLNKTGSGNPLYRGGGSIGIVGAARAGFVAAVDPDDETRRVLASTKQNLAPEPESMAYRLVGADNGAAKVEWLGSSTATASTLLASHEGDEERSDRDEAAEWLIDYLEANDGAAIAGAVIKAAAAVGIAKTTLTRARKRAGVISVKAGMRDGWTWSLGPRRIHEETEGPGSQDVGSSVPSLDSSGYRTDLPDSPHRDEQTPGALFDPAGQPAPLDPDLMEPAVQLVADQLGAVVIEQEEQPRCGGARLDGQPCRTPVARQGLRCAHHAKAAA